jgi:hypothetical protein
MTIDQISSKLDDIDIKISESEDRIKTRIEERTIDSGQNNTIFGLTILNFILLVIIIILLRKL